MAVTYYRYKFVTVSLPRRFRNGRFTSETAVRFYLYIVFQGGDDGRGYRNMCKIPQGFTLNDGH
jgi:hypothetical protein